MIILPRAAQRLWLTALIDYCNGNGPGPFPILLLRLYVNDISPGEFTNVADFTEASYNGYAPRAVGPLFPFPVTNLDGLAESSTGSVFFVPADNQVEQTVHGWYLTLQSDIVPAVLVACERIVPSVRMSAPGAQVCIDVQLALGSRFA